jgi:hypothetical protein
MSRLKATVTGCFFVLVSAVIMIGYGQLANAKPVHSSDWTRGYSACATEDSSGPCYWDAQDMGNGHGRSFVVTADGQLHYR